MSSSEEFKTARDVRRDIKDAIHKVFGDDGVPMCVQVEQDSDGNIEWHVMAGANHLPKRIQVYRVPDIGKTMQIRYPYVEQDVCHPIREVGQAGMHERIVCSKCGCVLATETFVRVWQKFCPTCGSKVIDLVGAR